MTKLLKSKFGINVKVPKCVTIIFLISCLATKLAETSAAAVSGDSVFSAFSKDLLPCLTSEEILEPILPGATTPLVIDYGVFIVWYHLNLMLQFQRDAFKDFVNETFNAQELEELKSNKWSEEHLAWLPGSDAIPKKIGDRLPESYLKSLEMQSTMQSLNVFLQAYAIGLKDLKNHGANDPSQEALRDKLELLYSEFHILRCSFMQLFKKLNYLETPINAVPDVIQKKAYSPKLKSNTIPVEKINNYLIFRDYINFMEYMTEVIGFIQKFYYVNES